MQNYLSVSPGLGWTGTNFLAQSLPSSSLGRNDFLYIWCETLSSPHCLYHTSQSTIAHYSRQGENHNLLSGLSLRSEYKDEDEGECECEGDVLVFIIIRPVVS